MGILSLPSEKEDCWKPRRLLKGPMHRLTHTHSKLQQRDNSSKGARDIWGESELCGFRARAATILVWSPPTNIAGVGRQTPRRRIGEFLRPCPTQHTGDSLQVKWSATRNPGIHLKGLRTNSLTHKHRKIDRIDSSLKDARDIY